jgi:hypothetical protein
MHFKYYFFSNIIVACLTFGMDISAKKSSNAISHAFSFRLGTDSKLSTPTFPLQAFAVAKL